MDVAGLSPERGTRPSATHRSAGTRDRRGRRHHTGAPRAETARHSQEPSRPAPALERVADALAAAGPESADQQQADYFVRLLAGRRGFIDQRIEEYQRKIGTAEAKGDLDAVVNLRRLVRIGEQDRRTLDDLLDKLRRRFVRRVAQGPR
ncbi:hypothetical protein [Mycobacterium colombiense]|uniref:Uncharacterized protein n=1 Tax=Mycobacterium colombiense TaxID=339268 RepID=A0A1A2Z7D4_9MYCO|nr:hypothetical protein [Mycobacterium colombiense]OBI46489.1 hypothetical protein A5708_01620 [Mycobacterium colombiense]